MCFQQKPITPGFTNYAICLNDSDHDYIIDSFPVETRLKTKQILTLIMMWNKLLILSSKLKVVNLFVITKIILNGYHV